MKGEKEGSITVFLSLILLLILSVLMTTIEAARVNAAGVHANRALLAAMDSVLAEYYAPLFEEYHIFGLDSGYGTKDMDTNVIIEKLEDYMEYTFWPSKNLSPEKNVFGYFNLYGITTSKIEVNSVNTMMDYQGKLFTGQAVAYMKYKAAGNGLEGFLNNLSALEETEEAQTILQQKQIMEERLYQIDEKILDLMSFVDGISIGGDGIERKGENIVVKDYFAKKICIMPITQENVGINNDWIYNSLKENYVNPIQIIDGAMGEVNTLFTNLELKNEARITHLYLTLVDQSEMKEEELVAHLSSIKEAKNKLDTYTKIENDLIKTLKKKSVNINQLVEGTLESVENALEVINELIPLQETITGEINNYESLLENSKDLVGEEFYKSLLEQQEYMEKYKSSQDKEEKFLDNYDFKTMKATLLNNQDILKKIKSSSIIGITTSPESWDAMKVNLGELKGFVGKYSYNKLCFDYSTLTKPVESDSFFQGIKSLLEEGIMGLVLEDTDKISKKELKGIDLPTALQQIGESDTPNDLSSKFTKLNLKSKNVFSDFFSGNTGEAKTVPEGLDMIGEFLLLQEYIMEHFTGYETKKEESILALDYELEYILMGKNSDYDNLSGVIMKILLIRTILNLITIISDSQSNKEAKVLAISFVGFTGLPALIEMVKAIILTVWAFTESIVDLAALLNGKMVDLMKKGSDLKIELYDIFLLNKSKIKEKASQISDSKSNISLGYKDYLKLFLYMENQEKKCFRAMDLIQENIQIKYEDTFFMKNILQGVQVNATFEMEEKFIALPFVQEILTGNNKPYEYQITKEYAY